MAGSLVQVRKAARERKRAACAFNDAVVAAHEAGLSYRQIAVEAGITFQGVAKIVRAAGK